MKLETDSSCFSAKPRRENDTVMSTNPWLIQRSLKAKNTTWKDLPKTRDDIQKQTKKITNRIHTWKKPPPQAKARLTSSSHENSPSYLRKIHLLPKKKLPQVPPLGCLSPVFLVFLSKPAVLCPPVPSAAQKFCLPPAPPSSGGWSKPKIRRKKENPWKPNPAPSWGGLQIANTIII